jgi:hypothetical protein
MPLKDSDEVFIAATVSVIGAHPQIQNAEGRPDWLCNRLEEFKARPQCSLIRPSNGYGRAIAKKLGEMDVMARATRLVTGANAKYLPMGGIPFRNTIWSLCAQDAVQGPLLRAVIEQPVISAELYFDQKTMAPETRTLFRSQINRMPGILINSIKATAKLNARRASAILDNIQFDRINVRWSDEPGTADATGGLTLAHYLASLTRKEMLRGRSALSNLLISRGFDGFLRDVTNLATRPISLEAVRDWESLTGLPRPKSPE